MRMPTRLVVLSVMLAAALPAAAAGKAVRVGLVAPLTGGSADFGNSVRLGAELAVKEINEFGGYLGRPLELVVRDDKANPDEGRKASQNLVLEEKVDFTIGFCNTGVAMKSIDVFQDNKHLLVVPCSTGTAVTTKYKAADSTIFRVAAPDGRKVPFLISEIVDRRKLRKVALMADTTGYGDGGINDATKELDKRGLKPVYVGRFPLGVTSLTDKLKEAKAAGAEALLVYTVGPEHAVAVTSRAELGWKVPYFAPWPLSFRSVLDKAGADALEGTMMAQTIIHDTANERRMSFLARYYKHSTEKQVGSLMAAAQAYDSVHLVLRAVFQTRGNTSGQALKNALENLERPYQGVVTTYANPFSTTDHDAFTENMIWLGVWRKGEIGFYYPEDAKLSGMVRRKETVAAAPASGAR
jgi:branched-chain amino acid transport system substrate-binding protein